MATRGARGRRESALLTCWARWPLRRLCLSVLAEPGTYFRVLPQFDEIKEDMKSIFSALGPRMEPWSLARRPRHRNRVVASALYGRRVCLPDVHTQTAAR